ncbi:ribbon-helix-helix protein, CopG family [Desulfomonile tiedjei]|uniref:Ribbon-helix-helix protein, copG family n=1 Tax=Desulfomonile tiedjei (strain ATCC 49306 / DSM 6799 / DCB-1) TaxID=706587 RepID=I4C8Z3_DESTA|nr:ribbon-helix-helix protein, CopG family [Desulfomonile tiedjei]AFM26034.1 hypothetical protein Desti_3379 [Desulfomonile tiedjei DSM 6799]
MDRAPEKQSFNQTIAIKVDASTADLLANLAAQRGQTVSSFVRGLIDMQLRLTGNGVDRPAIARRRPLRGW